MNTRYRNLTGSFHRAIRLSDTCYEHNPFDLMMGGDEECSSIGTNRGRIATWVKYLSEAEYAVTALSQAAVLANQAVLESAGGEETLTIYGRKGVDYSRSDISTTSMVDLWLLIAIDLCALIFNTFGCHERCLDWLSGQSCYGHYDCCLVW